MHDCEAQNLLSTYVRTYSPKQISKFPGMQMKPQGTHLKYVARSNNNKVDDNANDNGNGNDNDNDNDDDNDNDNDNDNANANANDNDNDNGNGNDNDK